MFGFGAKKNKAENKQDSVEPPVSVEVYDHKTESVLHVMPGVFKKQRYDNKKARSTGLLIIIVGGFFVLSAIVALGYYWLKPSSNKIVQPQSDSLPVKEDVVANQSVKEVTVVPVNPVVENLVASSSVSTEPPISSTTPSEIINEAALIVEPIAVVDADGDGLFDAEEALLGTDPRKSDSDGDGYSDSAELRGGYNPAGIGKLSSNDKLVKYENASFSVYYPVSWSFKNIGTDQVIITTADNQLVQINTEPNVSKLSIADWYLGQFKTAQIDPSLLVDKKDIDGSLMWSGVKSSDGLNYYLTDVLKQSIVNINYNLGQSSKVEYPNIVSSVVMSFQPKYGGN